MYKPSRCAVSLCEYMDANVFKALFEMLSNGNTNRAKEDATTTTMENNQLDGKNMIKMMALNIIIVVNETKNHQLERSYSYTYKFCCCCCCCCVLLHCSLPILRRHIHTLFLVKYSLTLTKCLVYSRDGLDVAAVVVVIVVVNISCAQHCFREAKKRQNENHRKNI